MPRSRSTFSTSVVRRVVESGLPARNLFTQAGHIGLPRGFLPPQPHRPGRSSRGIRAVPFHSPYQAIKSIKFLAVSQHTGAPQSVQIIKGHHSQKVAEDVERRADAISIGHSHAGPAGEARHTATHIKDRS